MPTFLAIMLSLVGVLLMFIILLQRGRGGGLAGALGGAGGQSAFGTKAGDVFTKITIVMAVIWVVLSGVTGISMFNGSSNRFKGGKGSATSVGVPAETDSAEKPSTGPLDTTTGTGTTPESNE